jgi:hypothetical protein
VTNLETFGCAATGAIFRLFYEAQSTLRPNNSLRTIYKSGVHVVFAFLSIPIAGVFVLFLHLSGQTISTPIIGLFAGYYAEEAVKTGANKVKALLPPSDKEKSPS